MPIPLGVETSNVRNSNWTLSVSVSFRKTSLFRRPTRRRAAKQRLDVSRQRLIATSDFRIDLLFTMSDNMLIRLLVKRRTSKQVCMNEQCSGVEAGARIEVNAHRSQRASWPNFPHSTFALGGARRDRTDDLLLAKQALSQLSYGPGCEHVALEGGGPGKT